MKIVFIGSGSIIFVQNLIGDCLLTPCLADAEYALLDIDAEKLALSERMLQRLNESVNSGRAHIRAYTSQKEALRGADFVISAIQVGGYRRVVPDFEIPAKYGLKQTYADTLGIGGIFRGLRTVPVMQGIVRDMMEVCPDAWLLNYVNPMAIITGAMLKSTGVKMVGLCHSVQVCASDLLRGLGMPTDHLRYKIAGINHQAWLLELEQNSVDIYPEVRKRAFARKDIHPDMVRYEIFQRFGYYVTESTQHTAEYTPYFIKRAYPGLAELYGVKTEMYRDWGKSQQEYWSHARKMENEPLTHTRTKEFASYILEAMTTGTPFEIAANVLNHGYIENLPQGCCVEVPCVVDAAGITPRRMGRLPEQCAALNRTNINVQELTIEAALTHKREHIYHAAMLDPHTAAELSISDIIALCDEMIESNAGWIGNYE